ncbi:membrane protein DedA with SNARE-associated domain [Hamadaea flava]|uniref:DedA family protein n=1 Tax=Hamadaea flava TaxID=1742688 RepID=A0ABV8LWZ3_9ACTN|nr:DedA family protein [Hamadaea flava]MCP2328756.1 membrane protein DedA with SNARE-associated domain [Hamadaea flava]
MSGLLDHLTSLPAGWVYLTVALLVFTENVMFLGFLIPGETAAILGGVTASTGHTNVVTMAVVVVLAAIAGDSVGYQIGRRYGVRMLDIRPLRRRRRRIDQARQFLAKHGGPAVFFGRFVAFLRTAMPFLAGTAHLRYRTFLSSNAVGGLIWGAASVVLGYLAGNAYRTVAARFGEYAALTVAVIAIVAVIVWRVRHRREQ